MQPLHMTSPAAPCTIIVLAAPHAAKPQEWYRQQLANRDTTGHVPTTAQVVIASFYVCEDAVPSPDGLFERSAVVSSLITAVFSRARQGEDVIIVLDLGPAVTWNEITQFMVSRRMPLHTLTVGEVQPGWYHVTDGRPTQGTISVVWV